MLFEKHFAEKQQNKHMIPGEVWSPINVRGQNEDKILNWIVMVSQQIALLVNTRKY